jgi:hypothetical protein
VSSIHGLLSGIEARLAAIETRLAAVEATSAAQETRSQLLAEQVDAIESLVLELRDARRGPPRDLDALEALLVAEAERAGAVADAIPDDDTGPLDLPAGAPLEGDAITDPDATPSSLPHPPASGSTTSSPLDPPPAGIGASGGNADAAPAGAQGGPARATVVCSTCGETSHPHQGCACDAQDAVPPALDIPIGARVHLAVTTGPRIGRLLGWLLGGGALVDLGAGAPQEVSPDAIIGVDPAATGAPR